jgi:hypothetical protein
MTALRIDRFRSQEIEKNKSYSNIFEILALYEKCVMELVRGVIHRGGRERRDFNPHPSKGWGEGEKGRLDQYAARP